MGMDTSDYIKLYETKIQENNALLKQYEKSRNTLQGGFSDLLDEIYQLAEQAYDTIDEHYEGANTTPFTSAGQLKGAIYAIKKKVSFSLGYINDKISVLKDDIAKYTQYKQNLEDCQNKDKQ